MGYDYSTGRCDEQCPGCKNYACIDNPDKKRVSHPRMNSWACHGPSRPAIKAQADQPQ